MKGELIILVGIPGSGKSTFAKEFVKNYNNNIHAATIISSDTMRMELWGDESAQYSREIAIKRFKKKNIDISGLSEEEIEKRMIGVCNQLVFGRMISKTEQLLESGTTVVYDATNITRKNRVHLLKKMEGHYRFARCDVFIVDEYTAYERDKKRDRTVGLETITRMNKAFQMPVMDEGFGSIVIHKQEKEESNGYKKND